MSGTVYVVCESDYDNTTVRAVFPDKESADAYVAELDAPELARQIASEVTLHDGRKVYRYVRNSFWVGEAPMMESKLNPAEIGQ